MVNLRISFVALLVGLILPTSSTAQNPIVMRDLTLITDAEIVAFDAVQVTLSNQKTLAWKDILQANVGEERQDEFDRLIKVIGLPRYRLEFRLHNQDWAGAAQVAEKLIDAEYPLSNIEQFQVSIAVAKARISSGKNERAVLPFLRSIELLKELSPPEIVQVAKYRWPAKATQLSFCDELIPIFFDKQAAVTGLNEIVEAANRNEISLERGANVYLAALAIQSGRLGQTDPYLEAIESDSDFLDWLTTLRAQMKLEQGEFGAGNALLSKLASTTSGLPRAAAWYLQGRYYTADQMMNANEAMLALYKLAAIYGNRFPELGAASIHRAVEIATENANHEEAEILRNELLRRHPSTYHGRLLKLRR